MRDPHLEHMRRLRPGKTVEHTREVHEVKIDKSALDALRVEYERKLQGLAVIIDGLSRKVADLETRCLSRRELEEFASGLAAAMHKRDAA